MSKEKFTEASKKKERFANPYSNKFFRGNGKNVGEAKQPGHDRTVRTTAPSNPMSTQDPLTNGSSKIPQPKPNSRQATSTTTATIANAAHAATTATTATIATLANATTAPVQAPVKAPVQVPQATVDNCSKPGTTPTNPVLPKASIDFSHQVRNVEFSSNCQAIQAIRHELEFVEVNMSTESKASNIKLPRPVQEQVKKLLRLKYPQVQVTLVGSTVTDYFLPQKFSIDEVGLINNKPLNTGYDVLFTYYGAENPKILYEIANLLGPIDGNNFVRNEDGSLKSIQLSQIEMVNDVPDTVLINIYAQNIREGCSYERFIYERAINIDYNVGSLSMLLGPLKEGESWRILGLPKAFQDLQKKKISIVYHTPDKLPENNKLAILSLARYCTYYKLELDDQLLEWLCKTENLRRACFIKFYKGENAKYNCEDLERFLVKNIYFVGRLIPVVEQLIRFKVTTDMSGIEETFIRGIYPSLEVFDKLTNGHPVYTPQYKFKALSIFFYVLAYQKNPIWVGFPSERIKWEYYEIMDKFLEDPEIVLIYNHMVGTTFLNFETNDIFALTGNLITQYRTISASCLLPVTGVYSFSIWQSYGDLAGPMQSPCTTTQDEYVEVVEGDEYGYQLTS